MTLINKLLAIEPEKRGSSASALRSEFFTTEPLPAKPSNLPRYLPSKELDTKLRNEEARKKGIFNSLLFLSCGSFLIKFWVCRVKGEDKKRRGGETVTRERGKDLTTAQTPEFIAAGQSKVTCISHKFKTDEEGGTWFRIEPPKNGYAHASTMVHPSVANKNGTVEEASKDKLTQSKDNTNMRLVR